MIGVGLFLLMLLFLGFIACLHGSPGWLTYTQWAEKAREAQRAAYRSVDVMPPPSQQPSPKPPFRNVPLAS